MRYQTRSYRSSGRMGCVIVSIIIIASIGIPLWIIYSTSPFQSLGDLLPGAVPEQTVTMKPHPTVIVEGSAGTVYVHASTSATLVSIEGWQSYDMSQTNDQASNTLTIHNTDDDITINTPANSNLKIDASDIEVLNISGEMNLVTNGGTITLLQSTLQGQSMLSTNGGSIVFVGTIAPDGTYKINNNGGSVDLTLPHTASFHLDVTGNIDQLLSTFPQITLPTDSSEIHADIGSTPTNCKLMMDVNGTLILFKSAGN